MRRNTMFTIAALPLFCLLQPRCRVRLPDATTGSQAIAANRDALSRRHCERRGVLARTVVESNW